MRMEATWLVILLGASVARAAGAGDWVRQADAAAARCDARRALDLYLEADRLEPNDAAVLQKIARQYSDLADDQPSPAERRRYVDLALDYADRAVRLAPRDPTNVLSLAICHGKLAAWGSVREKIEYSRLVKQEADRALALDPRYAWAHDVLGQWNCALATLNPAERFFVRIFYGGLPPASRAEGIAQLRRAVELDPAEPAHWIELGLAYLSAGRTTEARAELARGLALKGAAKFQAEEKQRARAALASLRPPVPTLQTGP
jgi:tetratricopeptide (TPR) repeat protein